MAAQLANAVSRLPDSGERGAVKVLLPDLGSGNFSSVVRMVEKVGGECELVTDPAALLGAERIILAGVGAFDHAMARLEERGWREPLDAAVLERRVPVLGICLGMQLMGRGSEEGTLAGLGWIDAFARRFQSTAVQPVKIPHMGWNLVDVRRPDGVIPAGEASRFYFTHSYRIECGDPADVVGITRHGGEFVSAFGRGTMHGVQFHPEKSHRFGMGVIKRFLEL